MSRVFIFFSGGVCGVFGDGAGAAPGAHHRIPETRDPRFSADRRATQRPRPHCGAGDGEGASVRGVRLIAQCIQVCYSKS